MKLRELPSSTSLPWPRCIAGRYEAQKARSISGAQMKVLVAGASGLVGRRLVDRLLADNHEVVALSRDPDLAELELPVRCQTLGWSPGIGNLDVAALRGIDAIVQLAGEGVADSRWTPARKAAIRESRVATTRLLINAVNDCPIDGRPKVFLSASAIGYYGDCGDQPLDESGAEGEGFLADVCVDWEAEIAGAEDLGMRTACLRTGIVLAREGGALPRILPPFRLFAGGRIGSGKQWMSWIHVDDLVSMFMYALENDSVVGPVNAVAPNPVTNKQFTKILGQALGRPALLPAPAWAVRAVLGEMSTLVLDSQRVHPAAMLEVGFRFDYETLEHALQDLCTDFAIEFRQEIWLENSPEEVFPFFSDVYNLERLTPANFRFKVFGVSDAKLRDGTEVRYKFRLRGIPVRWRSRIDVWDPPRAFVDSQVSGPCKTWHHTHEFEPFDGGTIVRDRVRYEIPLGVIGEFLGGWLVRRDVEMMFAYRREAIFDHFIEPSSSSIWSG
ncbi:MAG: hypothetical protein ACI8TX_002356 [Hyphomicrobiaceae bacterium]|jgi:uncharacterized protein (TIGR01777 family)